MGGYAAVTPQPGPAQVVVVADMLARRMAEKKAGDFEAADRIQVRWLSPPMHIHA